MEDRDVPVDSPLLGGDSGMLSMCTQSLQGPGSEPSTQVALWADVWSSWDPLCPPPCRSYLRLLGLYPPGNPLLGLRWVNFGVWSG